MIGFGETLDTTDFDALVAIAKSQLPSLAPEWTDYNIHDPGIMLVELLAWVADIQVYSLARNRRDERLAMAALLNRAPRGAIPATGLVEPLDPVDELAEIPAQVRLVPDGGVAPRLETAVPVTLLPVEIDSIRATGPGFAIDNSELNRRGGASYAAFGSGLAEGAELHIVLRALAGQTLPGDRPFNLSLGFLLENGNAGEDARGLGSVLAVDGASGAALKPALDTTDGLQRSGVMVFTLPTDPAHATGKIEIVLRRSAPVALMPRLLRIAPNVLAVVQQATLKYPQMSSTGRPGQTVKIEPTSLFDNDEAVEGWSWWLRDAGTASETDRMLTVGVAKDHRNFEPWQSNALENAEPDDQFYAWTERPDGTLITLRFGNGINGAVPPEAAPIAIGFTLSAGSAGNVASAIDWTLDGFRTRWRNLGPITGGTDAQNIDATLKAAAAALAASRIHVTSAQIVAAARGLSAAFGIDRIDIVEGWERGRRTPAVPATRSLLVTRRDHEGESSAWLRAIQRALAPRIALGERLLVATPVYRLFGLRAQVQLAVGRDAATVIAAIRKDLDDRIEGKKGHPLWPLARDVDATAIAGWIRRIVGVARVVSVTLLDGNDAPLAGDRLSVGKGELPRLAWPADIVIAGGA